MRVRCLGKLSTGMMVGQVAATNAILRFAIPDGRGVHVQQDLELEDCKWDGKRQLLTCARVAPFTGKESVPGGSGPASGPIKVFFLGKVSAGVFVGQVCDTNSILRFSFGCIGPANLRDKIDIEDFVWDAGHRLIHCTRIAQWECPAAVVRKRKALFV